MTEQEKSNTALVRIGIQGVAFVGGVVLVDVTHGNAWVAAMALAAFGIVTFRVAGAILTMHLDDQLSAAAARKKAHEKAREKARETVVGSV